MSSFARAIGLLACLAAITQAQDSSSSSGEDKNPSVHTVTVGKVSGDIVSLCLTLGSIGADEGYH